MQPFDGLVDTSKLAPAVQALMGKATIVGADVPLYVACHNFLQEIVDGRFVVVTVQTAQKLLPSPPSTDQAPRKRGRPSKQVQLPLPPPDVAPPA